MLYNLIIVLSVVLSMGCVTLLGLTGLPCVLAAAGLALVWFLLLGLLAALVLFLICRTVDQTQPVTEDSPFFRKLAGLYIDALIRLFRIRLHPSGFQQAPKEGRFFLVCNHLFIADPALLMHCLPRAQLAFVTKKENEKLPFVGPIMHKLLCQSIDRDNDRASLKGILNCIKFIKEDKASIGIFPEGGTSKDGKLHKFRAGAFKIAQRTRVPIVVCTIQNSKPIFHNALRFKPTHIQLHLVKVIQPEEYEGMNTNQMADMAYNLMLQDLGEDFRPEAPKAAPQSE